MRTRQRRRRARTAGGDGAVRRLRFLEPLTAAIVSSSRRVPPYGLAGGLPGACGRNAVERADGTRRGTARRRRDAHGAGRRAGRSRRRAAAATARRPSGQELSSRRPLPLSAAAAGAGACSALTREADEEAHREQQDEHQRGRQREPPEEEVDPPVLLGVLEDEDDDHDRYHDRRDQPAVPGAAGTCCSRCICTCGPSSVELMPTPSWWSRRWFAVRAVYPCPPRHASGRARWGVRRACRSLSEPPGHDRSSARSAGHGRSRPPSSRLCRSKISRNAWWFCVNAARTAGSKCPGCVRPSPCVMMSTACRVVESGLVGPLAAQGVVDVAERHDARRQRDRLAALAVRIAPAVPALVVVESDLGAHPGGRATCCCRGSRRPSRRAPS